MAPSPEDIRSLVTDYTDNRIGRRQFLNRAALLGISSSAAGVLLSACGSSSPSKSAGGTVGGKPPTTTLTYRPANDVQVMDPALWVSQDDAIIFNCINEGLVTFKPGTWDVVNLLAETFEPSSDGLRFHFTLKKGIEWQKGYGEVRASDVKFSYERIAGLTKPKVSSPYSGDWSALDHVQVTGPYEGTIILKQPFAPIMHSTLPAPSGLVLSEKAVTKFGKHYGTNPVGSGPYEFVSWVPGQHTTLKRFAKYGGANKAFTPEVPWDTIQTDVISSDNTAYSAIQTGGTAFGYIPASLVSQAQSASNLNVLSRPTLNYYFLAISQKNVPNLNLRRAIRSAIDVPGVIKAAYAGKFARAYGIIPQSMGIGYWAGAPRYNQDLPLAKHYLAQSGEKNVTLTLTTTNDQPSEAASQIIAANLQQIGIKVNVQPEDPATYNAIPGNGGGGPHRQLVYAQYVSEPDPYWSFIWFTCAQIGLWNWVDWCDPHFTALLNEGLRTYDVAKRNQAYISASRFWDAQSNIVWIAYPTWYYAAQKWLRPSLRPDGYVNLWATTAT